MDIGNCIEIIIDNGRIEDMHTLSEILEETMEHLENCDEKMYKKYEMELYKMAYGTTINIEMAEDIVENMRPYRMRWSYDEIRDLQQQYGLDNIRSEDLFLVMNSAYNDYRDLFGEDVEMYIKFAIDFIQDEDAKEDKVFIYYTTIPNN